MDIRAFENISMTILELLVCGVVIYYLRNRHLERMERIRQQVPEDDDPGRHRNSVLGKGILVLSLGIGLLVGLCLAAAYPDLPALVLYLVTVLLFSGLGLLFYYLILRKTS